MSARMPSMSRLGWRILSIVLSILAGSAILAQDALPVRSEAKPFRPALSKLPPSSESAVDNPVPGTVVRPALADNSLRPAAEGASAGAPLPDRATGDPQSASHRDPRGPDPAGREIGPNQPGLSGQTEASIPAPQDSAAAAQLPGEITRVSQTLGSLPNEAGQVWREYDILPYTSQIKNSEHPEQAIVDWIVRQTGTDLWFHQPLGILSATRERLVVYHTPEIHNEIRPLVDRFVFSKGQVQGIDVRLCTVGNPNWRESVYSVLQPIAVQTPGVEAWVISKENASLLLGSLGRRADFVSQAGGRVTAHDGQSFTLEQRTPRQFAQSILWTPGQGAGYQPVLAQINEGYQLEMACLSSLDGKTVDVRLKCAIDQIEKFNNLRVPVPHSPDRVQRVNLQVPQWVSWRLEERIRWPADQVLLISCGVVATPENPGEVPPLGGLLDLRRNRADALLFIDFRGPDTRPPVVPLGPHNARGDLVPIR